MGHIKGGQGRDADSIVESIRVFIGTILVVIAISALVVA